MRRMSRASPPTRRFFRPIWWRVWWKRSVTARHDLACAASGGREHPVFGLWPVRLREDLRHAVVVEGIRKVDLWTARYRLARCRIRGPPG